MDRRAKGVWAYRRPVGSTDIVMVCRGSTEGRQVSDMLSELGAGTLALYEKVEDLALNAPAGAVSLAIIAGENDPAILERSLRWLRRWRPAAACAVIADPGRSDLEIAARSMGAGYFVRPVAPDQWRALLAHAVQTAAARGRVDQPGLAREST